MNQTVNFNLVHLAEDGEPRASTEAIALGYKISHEAVIKLVRRYKAKIETFGLVRFEIRARLKGQHGGSDVEYALLNERQASFLLSLMRNTKQVVEFKLAMAHEFWRMSESLQNRDMTLWQRRIKFEEKDQRSKALGTIGSLLMTKRRVEKKPLDAERFLIESEMQPGMFVN